MADYVALDTDVASLTFRDRLPASISGALVGKVACVSFVTIGEMTKWPSCATGVRGIGNGSTIGFRGRFT
jgi:hypothetical protein